MTNPHARLFSHYPLFQVALAFAAGVMTTAFVSIPLILATVACAVTSLFALAAFMKSRRKVSGVSILLSIFFAASSLSLLEKRPRPNSLKQLLENGCLEQGQSALLTGVLDRPPELSRDRIYLVLRLEEIYARHFNGSATGLVALSALLNTASHKNEYQNQELHYGTPIRVKAILNRADQFRNPGVSTFTDYLDRKGFDASAMIKSPTAIVRLDGGTFWRPLSWIYRWRETIQQTIDQQFSRETAGVLDAALLGNRHNLSLTTIERFREGGTFHVLVISGLHISFIGGLVVVLAQRFTRRRIPQFVISSLVVWCYSVAVGAEASVVRAALMFTIVSFGAVIFRSASGLNALGASALIILVNKPSDLFDPSLQLTFLSVF